MYYIEENNKIVLFDENKERLQNTLVFMPQFKDLEIKETDRPIEDFEFADTEEHKERKRKEEEDRINHLTMTALDLITVIKELGITDEQVEEFLNSHLNIKHQLMLCQNVFCGVAKSLCPIVINNVTITAEIIEKLFIAKHSKQ